jgi:hypothetical protein
MGYLLGHESVLLGRKGKGWNSTSVQVKKVRTKLLWLNLTL